MNAKLTYLLCVVYVGMLTISTSCTDQNPNDLQPVIMGKENSLFELTEDEPIYYLVSGETVLPIKRKSDVMQYCKVEISEKNGDFTMNGKPIGYYDYYDNVFREMKVLNFCFDSKNAEKKLALYVDRGVDGDNLVYLKTNGGSSVVCEVFCNGEKMHNVDGDRMPDEYSAYEYKDGMSIIVNDGEKKKCEISIVSQNPLLVLNSNNFDSSSYADFFTRQVAYNLNNAINNVNCVDTICLSLDPILAKEFEGEMREYINRYLSRGVKQDEIWEMSMTIMDMATGEIIATPSVSTFMDTIKDDCKKLSTRNPVCRGMSIGCTFSPLLAMAAVQTNHSLLNLDTRGKVSPFNFFGAELSDHAWAENYLACWRGRDFQDFISMSDEVFPVALAVLSMNGYALDDDISNVNDVTENFGKDGSIFYKYNHSEGILMKSGAQDQRSIVDYELLQMINMLYNLQFYDEDKTNDAVSNDLWRFLPLKKDMTIENKNVFNHCLEVVTPDMTNMHYEHFHSGNSMREELVPWVLGQGNNNWNPLKEAEAWTRMLTKQPVRYTMVMSPNERYIVEKPLVEQIVEKRKKWGAEESITEVNNVWNRFLEKFTEAQKDGLLLSPMYRVVNELNDSDEFVLFSKTGSPDNYVQIMDFEGDEMPFNADLGMYTFSLMRKGEVEKVKRGETARGITCVIRIVRLSRMPDNASMQGEDNLLWSKDARNFFSNNSERFKKFYEMTKIYY